MHSAIQPSTHRPLARLLPAVLQGSTQPRGNNKPLPAADVPAVLQGSTQPRGNWGTVLRHQLAIIGLTLMLGTLTDGLLGAPSAKAQRIGSYFALVNTYGYVDGPRRGKRVLVKGRFTYTFMRSQQGPEGRMWSLVELMGKTRVIEGEGWISQGAHLAPNSNGDVLVFDTLPSNAKAVLSTLLLSHASIRPLNEAQTTKRFQNITWQKVYYKSKQLVQVWVLTSKGITRFGLRPDGLQGIYEVMLSQQTPPKKRRRLMGGVIHQGDSIQEVRTALGDPLYKQQPDENNTSRRVWDYPNHTVRFENGTVKEVKLRKNS